MLSILCVSRGDERVIPFLMEMKNDAMCLGASFCLCLDNNEQGKGIPWPVRHVHSDGYVESVLEEAISYCDYADWILRLDDDERLSPRMYEWLKDLQYFSAPVWSFPRACLWGDEHTYIANPPLWPDLQTRLTKREYAGGRTKLHQGSPFGSGVVAPVVIEHHKCLVYDREERALTQKHYEEIAAAQGLPLPAPYGVPEIAFSHLDLRRLHD